LIASSLMVMASVLGGCRDGRLVVALGEPIAVTTAGSTGLDIEPAFPGSRPGLPYMLDFQDFASVTVRMDGVVVLETGPAQASFSVAASGVVDDVVINIEATVPAAQRDTLVTGIYRDLLHRGWRYWDGNPPDVVGSISPQRWKRCLEGYSGGDDYPVPGRGGFFGAVFERSTSRWTAKVHNLFGCRLDGDNENPYIDRQFDVSLTAP